MKIFVVLNTDGSFYQKLHRWEPLDIKVIEDNLKAANIDYEITEISKLPFLNINPETDIIWYSSHQVAEKREYIKDVIAAIYLKNKDYKLVPSYELLLCHENKGIQELIKANKNINSLNGEYIDTTTNEGFNNIKFPLVLKYPHGAGSSTVFLIKDKSSYTQNLIKNSSVPLLQHLKFARKKLLSPAEDIKKYKSYFGSSLRHIAQPLVENLKFDYKILFFHEEAYVLKRFTRGDDFRASGSGIFLFDERVSDDILNYSYEIFKKFNHPFISLDICKDDEQCYLIEFQGVSFGPSTMMKSKFKYVKNGDSWDYKENDKTIEEAYANAVTRFYKS